jgi:tryptophan-rich sensory protein
MNNTYSWYQQLLKPAWAPPSWLFGPVWSVLYLIIAITYGTVFYKVATKQLPAIVALPFILNLIFNFAFTPIQFGLRNNALATVDILLTLITLIWVIVAIYPHIRWVALANIPYLGWVLFASVLQITITYMNWK